MAQSSGPISQGTTAERQFTDAQWRDLFGDEPGVIGDMDGTSYKLDLSSGTDVVNVGSSSQASLAKVAGFFHRIDAGSIEPITIPAASGSTRTDIIGLRYDPAYTGLPGPVRLYRTVGSSSSVPAYDASPPGVEDLPLWSITRSVGQSLSLATVTRMFPRIAPSMELPLGATLPTASPLGTIVRQGMSIWRRQLNPTTPAWVKETDRAHVIPISITPAIASISAGGAAQSGISGVPSIPNLVLAEAAVIAYSISFRAGSSVGNAATIMTLIIDGALVGPAGVARYDDTTTISGAVALAAGTHSVALRVANTGPSSIGWDTASGFLIEGV